MKLCVTSGHDCDVPIFGTIYESLVKTQHQILLLAMRDNGLSNKKIHNFFSNLDIPNFVQIRQTVWEEFKKFFLIQNGKKKIMSLDANRQ